MNEWRETTWGELVTLEYGKSLRDYGQSTGNFRVYGTNGPIGWHSDFLFNGDGVIIGRKGAYRGVHYSPEPFFVIDTAFYLKPRIELDLKWAYYELLTQDINGMDSGSAIPSTSREDFYALPVRFPPLSDQKAIADILGTLDDKIELNRRMNETLEGMARALFKSWFVDFDPVYAKAKGHRPKGMDAETAKLFPSSFQESEIGQVPNGWKVTPACEVADINGWTLGKSDEVDPIQYVEISEVSRGDIGDIQLFARGQEPSRARRRLRHGDTVLSTVRPDRRSHFLCLNPTPHLIASTGFAVLSPTTVPWSFLYAGLTQADVFEHLGQHADGGAYPAVRPELVGQMQLAIPGDSAVLEAFHDVCAGLFEKAANNRHQARCLASTRDSLLPVLLSGEVRIREAAG